MKIEGRFQFPAPRQVVWNMLLDPKALQHCMPGCKKFEPNGEDRFEVVLEMGVAGIKGTYTGKAQIADRQEPTSYKLIVEGSGTPGMVRGEGVMTLDEVEGGTTVSYVGDANASGLIANVGQRMLGGVAKMVVGQFFDCMRNQVTSGDGS